MKNILKVRMLGGFTLEYKGKELVLDRNNVSKTTQLFQLLLLHTQDGGISKAALIDALYGRSDVENKKRQPQQHNIQASKAAHRSGASGKQLHQYKWWNVYLGPGYRNFSRRIATSSRRSNQHVTKNPKRPKWKSTPKHGNSILENSSRI